MNRIENKVIYYEIRLSDMLHCWPYLHYAKKEKLHLGDIALAAQW
jgi:hypothetical protein